MRKGSSGRIRGICGEMPGYGLWFLFGAVLILALSMTSASAAGPLGPSALIDMPSTAISEATVYDMVGSLKYLSYTKAFLMGNAEAGGIKELSGDNNEFMFYGKMRFLPETDFMPKAALGISGIGGNLRDPSYFVAMSKTLSSLGITLHGGYFRQGKIKNISSSTVDSSWYGGAEFSLMGFTLIGEYWKEKVNVGVRMNLSDGLSISAISRDYESNQFEDLNYQIFYGVRM